MSTSQFITLLTIVLVPLGSYANPLIFIGYGKGVGNAARLNDPEVGARHSFLYTSIVYGKGVGNGGNTLSCTATDGSTYFDVLDYAEAKVITEKVQKNFFKLSLDVEGSFEENINILISRFEVRDKKLGAMIRKKYDSFFEEANFIPNAVLREVPDIAHTNIPKNCKRVQAILQRPPTNNNERFYEVDRNVWFGLRPYMQAGLVIHEILYRLYIAGPHYTEEPDSSFIRYINSLAAANQLSSINEEYWQSVRFKLDVEN